MPVGVAGAKATVVARAQVTVHRGIPGGNTEIAKITHKLRVFLYKLREKCN